MTDEHFNNVRKFIEEKKKENPDLVKEVEEKYPVLSTSRWKTIRRKEINVGLLGLQPSAISTNVAAQHDYESQFERDDE